MYDLYADGMHLYPPEVVYGSQVAAMHHVRMNRLGAKQSGIGAARQFTSGYGTSLMASVLLSKGAPLFSGKDTDWRGLSRQFLGYQEVLRRGYPGEVPETQRLWLLRTCLDETTQGQLQMRKSVNPSLTFSASWQLLEKMFSRDMEALNRIEWEEVEPQKGDGPDPASMEVIYNKVRGCLVAG